MLRAIVFDFDGVIVDSEPLHHAAFLRVAEPLGVRFDYEEYLEKYVGYDDRDAFRVMFGGAAGQGDALPNGLRLDELCRQKGDAFASVVAEGVQPVAGVQALMEEAAAQMPIAVASGATRRDVNLILTRLRWADRFAAIVTADDVHYSKPHPQTYVLAVQRLAERYPHLSLTPADCLAIEDTAAGVASARAAGLMTLGLATTTSAATLHHAHRVVECLGSVTLQRLRQSLD